MTFRPPLRSGSRPHMLLPTPQKLEAIYALLNMLIQLDVVNNVQLLAIPSYSHGRTYFHSGKYPAWNEEKIRSRSALFYLLRRLSLTY